MQVIDLTSAQEHLRPGHVALPAPGTGAVQGYPAQARHPRRTAAVLAQSGYVREVAVVQRTAAPVVIPGVSFLQHQAPAPVQQERCADAQPAARKEDANEAKCALCLETLKEDLCINPCGHVFHFQCMTASLARYKHCPRCRKGIRSEKQLKRIYM